MNNTMIFMFTLLNVFAELIELTYDMGVFTRQHILPQVIKLYVWFESSYTMEMKLNVIRTPITTGYAY